MSAPIRNRLGWLPAALISLGLMVGFIAVSPRRVISHENNAEVQIPGFKLPEDRIQLRPLGKNATVKDGRLYVDGMERGF